MGSRSRGEKGERKSDVLLQGIKAAWPICVGYIPLGFAFGVLAQKAGLNLLDIALMSMLVYAGSSQFIAVAMLNSAAACRKQEISVPLCLWSHR